MKLKAKLSFFWRSTILCLAFLMNMTLGYQLFFSDQSIFAWQNLQERYTHMQAELIHVATQKTDLSQEIHLLRNEDAYMGKLIRQNLNFVKDNEILYLFEKEHEENTKYSPWTIKD